MGKLQNTIRMGLGKKTIRRDSRTIGTALPSPPKGLIDCYLDLNNECTTDQDDRGHGSTILNVRFDPICSNF